MARPSIHLNKFVAEKAAEVHAMFKRNAIPLTGAWLLRAVDAVVTEARIAGEIKWTTDVNLCIRCRALNLIEGRDLWGR